MRKGLVISLLLTVSLLLGWKHHSSPYNLPDNWPDPVHNFKKEPLDERKATLGRRLFYDPVLSRDSSISCNSCHAQYSAFTHIDHQLSHGIDGKIGTRNSPVLFNLAWSKTFMWDGSVTQLEQQAEKPICNAREMDETMQHVTEKLRRSAGYRGQFAIAYGDTSITQQRLTESLAQFLLTLVSIDAKYDRVMRQADTFTDKEDRGYTVFKKNCASCHTEPLFTNGKFENNGLPCDTELADKGRYAVTGNKEDEYKFKVPTLRNIEYSAPYMHDGRFKTLYQVLNHYATNIHHYPTLSKQLNNGMHLEPKEKTDLVAFLLTLSDTGFIRNRAYGYPIWQ